MNALIVDPRDNVIVAIEPVATGDTVTYLVGGEPASLTATEDIIIYHKLAIRDIQKGEPVVKYGEHIGAATAFIPAGAHVHVHNVDSIKEDRRAKE
ncbi:UxaA family hydrolase [Oscillibacter sp.]|uniref:UxaA family hydrolase n=1 Tax=Oscillibacter sp. TaxID=1945593 RepID=UPI00289D22FE|nr:UxaA family hydrolase [Oscillibacter sp.]